MPTSQRVQRAKEYVRAGDIYQANLSRPWEVTLRSGGQGASPAAPSARSTSGCAQPIRRHLRPWRSGGGLPSSAPRPSGWCGSQGRRVDTRPIAGTRPRSRRPEAERRRCASLLAHPKERAEHIMLIDLERNDLGRVCDAGSVRVDELMTHRDLRARASHRLECERRAASTDVTPIDALRAVFPGGTITGCPKFRCMQIIAELEGAGRGAYTGSLGYLNRDGTTGSQHPDPHHDAQRAAAASFAPAPASSPTPIRNASWRKPAPRRAGCSRRWSGRDG